jgi:hypothetical protein
VLRPGSLVWRLDLGYRLALQFHTMKKLIAIIVAIAGLVYIQRYESARINTMPEEIRSSPAEVNAQHELELRSETPLQ